ncbi:isoprenylcysteine carboxylmethyltransferase family protein [Alteromonas aestuariivivens]|uniref:Isoprenylcysteine carboxylmethyltransferase family protein n=1 Tax=Alteromonas aestuariivivens TaxID=1938339 RepID=A0A3D8MB73_9ALTE|nr:isoprenylcysteine carboxylmethyltransferase family protein [Alteromonas aestuariivivens]RDV27457.1 isoprenylcysteine carboxylmethyltransferase family protein [Alteromonas aestuariivivens]
MKTVHFAISTVIYLIFWCVFSYLLVFIGGSMISLYVELPEFVKTVDAGPVMFAIPGIPEGLANALLVLAFGVQHSVMARGKFKLWLTQFVPQALERSVFVLATCVVLIWLYLAWQPMEYQVWFVSGVWSGLLQLAFAAGAGLVLWATFMISHGQLFGISQTWHAMRGMKEPDIPFITPSLYKVSRHPMYLGILFVLWATPVMTLGHLIASSLLSFYVFIGIGYEERDLLARFGKRYYVYMQHVPQILPIGFRKAPNNPAKQAAFPAEGNQK